MILRLFATVLFFGSAILLGILNVMRGLYASSTFQPPLIPSDSAAPVWVDNSHEQAREGGNEIVDLRHCKSPRNTPRPSNSVKRGTAGRR